jgi:hypothetical protein
VHTYTCFDVLQGPLPEGELGLRVALSVGELPEEDYQQLFDAGARRSEWGLWQEKRMYCMGMRHSCSLGTGVWVQQAILTGLSCKDLMW